MPENVSKVILLLLPELNNAMASSAKSKNIFAYCHPDKLNLFNGLCGSCYYKQNYAKNRNNRIDSVKKYQKKMKREYSNKWKETQRRSNLKKFYGITLEDYTKMFNEQKGQCAICGKTSSRALCVDHNHKTGKIRQLLCHACNYLVGIVENMALLLKIQDYVIKHDE